MAKYDVVVIGAGTGGLSAALSMATAGKKTLLIEQHNLPGGCSSSFIRGRFEFDASLHEYCGIGEPGNWGLPGALMMEKYKMGVHWIAIPEMYRCIGTTRSGRHVDLTLPVGIENIIKTMEDFAPGSEGPMRTFFDLCDECVRAYRYFDAHMDELDKNGFTKTNESLFMKEFPNFLRVAERPFNLVLRKIGMPEDAIDILNIYWTYIGADFEHLSFVHMAWMFHRYATLSPAICEYNAHGMTVAGVERFRELGGELWLNVKANKVVSDDNGKVIGVDTTAGFVETNYVIANMNPQTAYRNLLDKRIPVPKREIKRANAEKHNTRFFNAYVALNKSCEELGIKDYTIFMPGTFDTRKNFADSKVYEGNYFGTVVIYNVVNPNASPKGTTVMTFTVSYTEDVWGQFSQREYVRRKQETFQKVLENFERNTGIIIHDCIEEVEMATPWTFAHYLGTPHGTTYGYDFNETNTMVSRLMAYKKDQPIHGFKTVGAAGCRGDGYSQTYLNGNDIAKLILEEMEVDAK